MPLTTNDDSRSTIENLILDLQNPTTEAYKEMMNKFHARMKIFAIIKILIEKYCIEVSEARQLEKQIIIDKMIEKERREQKAFEQFEQQKANMEKQRTAAILNMKMAELHTSIERHEMTIKELETNISSLKTTKRDLQTKESNNTQAWKAMMHEEVREYKERLIENNLQFKGPQGIISVDDAMKMLTKIIESSPPPVRIADIVTRSYQEAALAAAMKSAELTALGQAVPPVPPPPPPVHLHQQSMLSTELKFIRALAGKKLTGPDLVHIQNDNKEALNHFPKAKLKIVTGREMHSQSLAKKIKELNPLLKHNVVDTRASQQTGADKSALGRELKSLSTSSNKGTGPELLKALREGRLSAERQVEEIAAPAQALFHEALQLAKQIIANEDALKQAEQQCTLEKLAQVVENKAYELAIRSDQKGRAHKTPFGMKPKPPGQPSS